MDLFELLQNDSQLTPDLINEISFLQQNFTSFKATLENLFENRQFNPKTLTNSSAKSLLVTDFFLNYYLEKLDFSLFHLYLPSFLSLLKNPLNLQKALEFLLEIFNSNLKFINEFQWNHLKTLLKERFRTIFIEETPFFDLLREFFTIELSRFKKLVFENYHDKFNTSFSSQLLLHFTTNSSTNLSMNSPEETGFFSVISLCCTEFEVIPNLESCLLALLQDDLFAFFRCDLSNFSNYETNDLLHNASQYSSTFLQSFLQNLSTNFTSISSIFSSISQKLELSIFEEFSRIFQNRLFDTILAYPDSENLLFSLKNALQNTNFIEEISESLLLQINNRLLIPGVITSSILNQYLNILKVLQLLDKSLIFSKITTPIKAYLLKRPDTLRCIIAHLTEDSQNYAKLGKEFVKIPNKDEEKFIEEKCDFNEEKFKEEKYELSSDENEEEAEKWEVLPLLNKKNSRIRVKYEESDLVSVLVNLYGSQEAFINEYQVMLAEKLLGAKEFNIEEESNNIELLKLRFGENNLQNCNIIVKDVKESKRIDQNLHSNFDSKITKNSEIARNSASEIARNFLEISRKNSEFSKSSIREELLSFEKVHVMFASKGYWPINYECESPLKMPADIAKIFEDYSMKYSKIKAMRKLIWHNQLGFVNLTLGFDNGEFEFKCLPIHAVLISFLDETSKFYWFFLLFLSFIEFFIKKTDFLGCNDKIGVSSEFLSKELNLPSSTIKQKMAFWVHKKVLREIKNFSQQRTHYPTNLRKGFTSTFFLNLEPETDIVIYFPNKLFEKSISDEENLSFFIDNDENSAILLKEANNFEEKEFNNMIEGLIMSMLTTNGPKSAEKIYNLLKTVYKTNVSYPYNESQTKEILKNMMVKQRIAFNGELYSAII